MATISNLLPKSDIMQYRLKKDEKLSEAPERMYSKEVLGKIPDTYTMKIDSIETWNKQNKTFDSITADDFLSADVLYGLNDFSGTAFFFSFMIQAKPAAIHKRRSLQS